MAITEVKIDDRYGIIEPFNEWADSEYSRIHEPGDFQAGYASGVLSAKVKLAELNREAQRIADANRAERP